MIPMNFVLPLVERGDKCELCEQEADTRPYGPNGEHICLSCAMADPDETFRKLEQTAFGRKQ